MSVFSKVMFSLALLFSTVANAQVTRSHHSLEKVQSILIDRALDQAFDLIPIHKSKSYIVEQSVSLGRGKFSTDEFGFADYSGQAEFLFQWADSSEYSRVNCRLTATVEVVPFAKQELPVIEEEVNVEQLVLKRAKVTCDLIN